MAILVFNSGSSSLKFRLFAIADDELKPLAQGMVSAFGAQARCVWQVKDVAAPAHLGNLLHALPSTAVPDAVLPSMSMDGQVPRAQDAVERPPSMESYLPPSLAVARARGTGASSATAPCVALPPESLQSCPADGQVNATIHNHQQAAEWVLQWLRDLNFTQEIAVVGHRVVHGGDVFSAPVRITDAVISTIESLNPLAPLHNPLAVQVMRASQAFFPQTIPHVAVFDTAFFHALPEHVQHYALPGQWTRDYGIKRYGFHGIAHRAMCERYHQMTGADAKTSRVITVQLGQGCSIAAIKGGVPVETSMGFTPLEGLIMATRSGDVDPGVLLHLIDKIGIDALREGLQQRAGLLGMSGVSADMAELLRLEAQHHPGATLAIAAFCHRARKYLGAYLAVLGGADAIIFGGGIGEHAPGIRARICAVLEWCGLVMDGAANAAAIGVETCLSASASKMAVYAVQVNEELLIARDARSCAGYF